MPRNVFRLFQSGGYVNIYIYIFLLLFELYFVPCAVIEVFMYVFA